MLKEDKMRLVTRLRRTMSLLALGLTICLGYAESAIGADWPMWRYDAGRTAASPHSLPEKLYLQWVRKLPPQITAWKDEASMKFDRSYEPIVLGKLVFVGSTVNDSITAYNIETGEQRWRFYADGPIRLALAGWKDRVFAASDDGCLYCLGAADGKLKWKFRGGPSDRRLVGNERLICTWPVRGGPVVADDKVYFAAGLWPFMGIFIYALDAETGQVVWTNDSMSFTFRKLPHGGAEGFSGISPQGHLAVVGEKLIVPGSRFRPAVLNRRTGALGFFAEGASPQVAGQGRFGFAGGRIFSVNKGYSVRFAGAASRPGRPVLGKEGWYTRTAALDPRSIEVEEVLTEDKSTREKHGLVSGRIKQLWRSRGTPWLLAGSKLVTSVNSDIKMLDVSDKNAGPTVVWQGRIEGTPSSMLAADGKLLVVSLEGGIYCFGNDKTKPRIYDVNKPAKIGSRKWANTAKKILKLTGVKEGYCLVWGLKDGGLVQELVRRSRLHIIAVDSDADKIESLRRRLDAGGLYGVRVAALAAEPAEVSFPPYLASLIVSEDLDSAGFEKGEAFAEKLFYPLRPYGGVACLPIPTDRREQFTQWVRGAGLTGARVELADEFVIIRRVGALPGSADWLGQNADAGNTRCSRDRLVKAPLGVLWFGNSLSNELILPRHGEGPVQQIAGGRMFIEGPDSISAMDVYTGRQLWSRSFPNVGKYYNSTKHQPGAHSVGSNFYAVGDAVYVSFGKRCYVLDPATGRTRKRFKLGVKSNWQFLLVYEDFLVAGAHPIVDESQPDNRIYSPTSSKKLVVMDRRTGKVLWTRDARYSFRHYGIAAGSGKLFCIDRVAPEMQKIGPDHKDQGPLKETPRILALDARDGAVVWESEKWVGGKLSYSAEYDILVCEAALRGADGEVIWHDPNTAKKLWAGKWGLMLRGRTILTQGGTAFDLLTGKGGLWIDDGVWEQLRVRRSYGCGPIAGSEHLLTFRSGCAGFFDLANNGGTGNLGGFRSGCTSNLIVADGVLCAPDYTRTCTCEYQNRSSLGLIHMPEAEYWTYGAVPSGLAPGAGRVGFNFGAPGDRRSADGPGPRGTLWLDYPSVGGPSPEMPVKVAGEKLNWFYHHSSTIKSGGLRWVAASGVVGVESVTIGPSEIVPQAEAYTVRLYFAEPANLQPGQRVFDVGLQGKRVLEDFDIVKAAGGSRRAIVREFNAVKADGRLTLTFTPKAGLSRRGRAKTGEPLICGIEIIREDTGQGSKNAK